ncbi:MAG: membrane protein [Herpetosiphonaceae bacterium]|nr:MAG: membrane protein [Herpetosiphonaceae bacterium]
MESRAKFLGHPIHPMLIVFPLGLFIASLIFDFVYLMTGDSTFAAVAFWNIAGGIIGGLIAAVFGFWDWLAIPSGTRAKAIGFWHGLGNVVVVTLFAIGWFLRLGNVAYEESLLILGLSIVAVGLGSVTAWLGGELVDRLGVGVDPGANLNSPSSLSDEPADANLVRAATETPGEAAPPPAREREVGGR